MNFLRGKGCMDRVFSVKCVCDSKCVSYWKYVFRAFKNLDGLPNISSEEFSCFCAKYVVNYFDD